MTRQVYSYLFDTYILLKAMLSYFLACTGQCPKAYLHKSSLIFRRVPEGTSKFLDIDQRDSNSSLFGRHLAARTLQERKAREGSFKSGAEQKVQTKLSFNVVFNRAPFFNKCFVLNIFIHVQNCLVSSCKLNFFVV